MKPVKLKTIIKHLGMCVDVMIEKNVGYKERENWEVVFEGEAMDVPWIYMNDVLLPPSEYGEPIEMYMKDGKPYLSISIIEKEDWDYYVKNKGDSV
jgi:hypothetical protein